MSRTYYVIELTAGWLAALLMALAVLMALAFAGGYGAAWSVLAGEVAGGAKSEGDGESAAIETVELAPPETDQVVQSVATPVPAEPTITPAPAFARPTAKPSPTSPPQKPAAKPPAAAPVPTASRPEPTVVAVVKPADGGVFWVQVLASGSMKAIEKARGQLNESGFPNENHKVVQARVAGGSTLLKLRIGPFPDRDSADRVMARMQRAGFPDAWVVKP